MPPRIAPVAPIEPTSDPSSPFFVHPSDGPSSVKVSPVLNGANYHAWSRSMRRALGVKLKIEFIDGSLPQPLDPFDPSIRAWNRFGINCSINRFHGKCFGCVERLERTILPR
jgi:hypothetical protein